MMITLLLEDVLSPVGSQHNTGLQTENSPLKPCCYRNEQIWIHTCFYEFRWAAKHKKYLYLTQYQTRMETVKLIVASSGKLWCQQFVLCSRQLPRRRAGGGFWGDSLCFSCCPHTEPWMDGFLSKIASHMCLVHVKWRMFSLQICSLIFSH